MPGTASVTYQDTSKEFMAVEFPTVNLTAANFAAQTTLFTDLLTAAQAISMGTIRKRQQNITIVGSGAAPTDALAQRETKWIVHYADNQATFAGGVTNPLYGKAYHCELGTADLANDNLASHSDFADLDDDEMGAFKTAFEAFAKSPSGGSVVINAIEHSGKRT